MAQWFQIMDSSAASFEYSEFSEGPPLLQPEISGLAESLEPQQTTVLYELDNDPKSLYSTTIPVPPSRFTLAHLKRALNRRDFKCFVPYYDADLKSEVKVDILDDHAVLKLNRSDRLFVHLVTLPSTKQLDRDVRSGTLRANGRRRQIVPLKAAKPAMNSRQTSRGYANYFDVHRQSRRARRGPVFEESRTSLDDTSLYDRRRYRPRNYSDSEASADFTTISEMEEKHRIRRLRRARSYSLTSSTCDDTDISMALNFFTVSIKMEPNRELGLKVLLNRSSKGNKIIVDEIIPGSLFACDGRVKKGNLIIAVNDYQLGDYPGDEAIKILEGVFIKASQKGNFVRLTYCPDVQTSRHKKFQLLDESVRPLDMEYWVDTVNQLRNHDQLDKGPTVLAGNRPCSSSGVGSLSSSLIGGRFPADAPHESIVRAMAHPITGINRRENTQLNLTISDSFTGQDLINWLADHVIGLDDRKRCELYANDLLRCKFILPALRKNTFTAFCYYTINDSKIAPNTMRRGVCTPLDLNVAAMDETLAMHKCNKKCAIKRLFCMHQSMGRKSK